MVHEGIALSDDEISRYSRQILLSQVDISGQLKLKQSKVLILGCGGLGCASATYLAAAGIGCISLIDFDAIDDSNLQRQIAFNESSIGEPKAKALANRLTQINRHIQVDYRIEKAIESNLLGQLENFDLVLDGCDNFETRFTANRAAVKLKTPLVSAAAIGFQGQLASFDANISTSPCYRCLYPDEVDEQQQTCHEAGVMGPLVGMLGSMQALEAIKLCLDMQDNLVGKLLLVDAKAWSQKKLVLTKDPNCPVCSL